MNIPVSLVKDLRDRTGVGIVDCKNALIEANGVVEEAVAILRKKGIASAAKKSSRIVAEGLASVCVDKNVGVIVELNAETDFVAKNDVFRSLASSISKSAINCSNVDELKSTKLDAGFTVEESIVNTIAVIGENISLRRMGKIVVNKGIISHYIHNISSEYSGSIAVLVGIETDCSDLNAANDLGKEIAMHIAAMKPISLNIEQVDPLLVQKEREIFFEQSKSSGKPDNIIEKMVDGRIRKFYEESVLMEQMFVIDNKTKISQVISEFEKSKSCKFTVSSFLRYEVGEGIEVKKTDFANDVMSMV